MFLTFTGWMDKESNNPLGWVVGVISSIYIFGGLYYLMIGNVKLGAFIEATGFIFLLIDMFIFNKTYWRKT